MRLSFIEKAKLVHNDKYDYSKVKYINSKTKVCIICPEHGEFQQTPNDHLQGKGCKKCGYVMAAIKNKSNVEKFIENAVKIHGNRYDYSKVNYVKRKEKVCIICPVHGEFWQTPHNHLSGNGCLYCANENRNVGSKSNTSLFIEKAKTVHGNRYDYSKVNYVNAKTKVCIICLEHGEFWQTPNNHLFNQGCPSCKQSKLENRLELILQNNNISYIKQKRDSKIRNKRSLPFDFYLKDYDLLIECQGEQHFKNNFYLKDENFNCRVKTDEFKYEKAKELGYDIIYFTSKYFFKKVSKIYQDNNVFFDENDIIKYIKDK
jgi:very-short-patch-repair endonuclease